MRTLLAFVVLLIKGATAAQAYHHAVGHHHHEPRQAWRWLDALMTQLGQFIWQLADSLKLDTTDKNIEKDLIKAAFENIRKRKTLYILIDVAHLLELSVLRKLRLLFERFPKNHNLVLFGQDELLHYLSLSTNKDIKSRITYSATIKPLNDDDMAQYIVKEL